MTKAKGMEPTGILHFAIGVTNLDEGRKFYEDVLGCTYLRENDTTVFMMAGNDHFVLTNALHHTPPNPPGAVEFHHAFMVEGAAFDAALKHLQDSGYPIGGRLLHCRQLRDPRREGPPIIVVSQQR